MFIIAEVPGTIILRDSSNGILRDQVRITTCICQTAPVLRHAERPYCPTFWFKNPKIGEMMVFPESLLSFTGRRSTGPLWREPPESVASPTEEFL